MRRTTPAVAAIGLSLVLSLSGCFANPLDQLAEGIVEGGVEQIIEDQTGVDVDVNGTGAQLPADWPAEVPTVAGTIQFSASMDNTFTAQISVASAAEAESAFAAMTAAGFTEVTAIDLGNGSQARDYENGTWNVSIITGPGEGSAVFVQYSVIPASQ